MTSVVPPLPYKETGLSAPVMAIPSRRSETHEPPQHTRTFFVTAKTSMGRRLLQSERAAALLVDVLRTCVAAGRSRVLDFVVMPDHVHLLISVGPGISIEKAMQFIKGGYRLRKELGIAGEVWQRGFSEVRVEGEENLRHHREYIAQNPIRAGLVRVGDEFAWCFETLKKRKAAGAETQFPCNGKGTSEQSAEKVQSGERSDLRG